MSTRSGSGPGASRRATACGSASRRAAGRRPRLLRYYEEQGLISPRRAANGYREYDERFVDRVTQIRGLLAAGLPTRVIQELLPCLDTAPSIEVPNPSPETIATLEREHERMSERIEFLAGNRDAIAAYLEGVRERADAAAPAQSRAAAAPKRRRARAAVTG